MHIYANEVKTMEDMAVLAIDVLGIHNVKPIDIEFLYDGKFYLHSMTLFRDEDVAEVKRRDKINDSPKCIFLLFTLFLILLTGIIVRITSANNSREVALKDL
jgi:hypothetical protein